MTQPSTNLNDNPVLLPQKPGAWAPATEAQKEIWISCQMGSGASCAYNQSFSLRFSGNLDKSALEKAISLVTGRHDALSTTFSPSGNRILAAPHHAQVLLVDLRNATPDKQMLEIEGICTQETATPFNLETGPLWRAKIITVSSEETLLVFTAHHIVCDGWSIGILCREFGAAYSALVNKTESPLDNTVSYFSYAEEQNTFLKTPRAAQVQDYWVGQFSHAQPTLDLPTDNPRPPRRTYSASCKCLDLDNIVSEKIKHYAANEGISTFSVLLGIFSALLQKLSGNGNVVIGVPAAGQGFSGSATLVGHCVSMLPIHLEAPQQNTSFSAMVSSLQDKLFDAYDHYNFSFGSLIKSLVVHRDPSRIPLVSVGFTYAKNPSSQDLGFKDLLTTYETNKRSFETFEIYAMVIERPEGFQLMWHFNADLFSNTTIARWLGEYEVLLQSALAAPAKAINALSVLTQAERLFVLETCNRTRQAYQTNQTIVEMFEMSVCKSPQSPAIECFGKSFTYQELNARAEYFAKQLVGMGATVESIVGVCVERSIDMVAALLGVLKAGAAYLPLDPAYPEERISFILSNSGANCLVTQSELGPRFASQNIPMLFVDAPAGENMRQHVAPWIKASAENLAYIIYTSGSTGKPKGVEICHRSLSNFLLSMQEQPGICSTDTLFSVTTISFDIAGLELLLPLTVGARVIIAESEIVADGQRLSQSLRAGRPTIMQATPSTWNLLLESGWKDGIGLTILCGGEAMTRTLADALLSTGATVWNMYGPTETTIWSALWRVEAGKTAPPVGSPIANTQLYILAPDLSPVPIGVAGELYIGGLGLARGYHNRPDLTENNFIQNPFAQGENTAGEQRMYKTGDVARRLANGSIAILGRSDFQVKIRGFRIELGEIETVLLEHPAIRECVVADVDDKSGTKTLVAYVVFRDAMREPVDLLLAALRRKLPFYMLPSQFVFLDNIPRLSNGKVNRAALPQPHYERPKLTMNFVAPATDLERSLASIWATVLTIKDFGVLDNFFDLGGHSMALASIHSKVSEMVKQKIDMVTLFEYPTIRLLANFLQNQSSAPETKSLIRDRANRQKAALTQIKRRHNE